MLSASLASARGAAYESRHDCTPFRKFPADSSGQQGNVLQM